MTFGELMDATTIGASTIQLRDIANVLVPALVSYDGSTSTATLKPNSALMASTMYTATVTTGAKDLAGNAMTAPVSWTFTTDAPAPLPPAATTTPILVVTSATNAFTKYYPEILRAEGLNDFTSADLSQVTTSMLNGVDLAVLGEQALTTAQVEMFSNWVTGGGKLIAMRPDKKLASLLGVSAQTGTLADAYLRIDTSKAPGAGLVADTIHFHGSSDQYLAVEAITVATLHSDATHPTSFPAVTLTGSDRSADRPRRSLTIWRGRSSTHDRAIQHGRGRSATGSSRFDRTTCSTAPGQEIFDPTGRI